VDDERYEVEGRWSGVRGRVFIRPELTLIRGRQSRRLLADLAHKPWQATDGATWSVAFPAPEEPIEPAKVELTVAPDITVPVKRGRAGLVRAKQAAPAGLKSEARADAKPDANAEAKGAARAQPDRRRRGLGVQLAEAQGELERMHAEQAALTDRHDAAMRQLEEARAERDAAYSKVERVIGERDAVAAERDAVAAERDAVAAERDDAVAERGTAAREAAVEREGVERSRDEALAELRQARNEIERVLGTAKATAAERDAAIRAGVEVERELSAAKTERQTLIEGRAKLVSEEKWMKGELKRLAAEQKQLRHEHEHDRRDHGQARAERAQPVASRRPSGERDFDWSGPGGSPRRADGSRLGARALALAALAVVVIALLVVLGLVSGL